MNRSNVLEIKKTLKISADYMPSIDTVCTCFVNGNKEKLISNTEKYSGLEEEEQFKYIDLLKGVLTGSIGKKLINLEYDMSCGSNEAQETMYGYFSKIFSDESTRDAFFTDVIGSYDFGENYLLVAGHGIYDAPVKTTDGAVLEDETNNYEFMIIAMCPVHLTKAGLTLDKSEGRMISSKQIPIVEAPVNGFLYPAFNDRASDVCSLLYYTKREDDEHSEFIEAIMGTKAPTSSVKQQNIFETILADVTNDNADFEMVKALHENLKERAENSQMASDDKKLTKSDIKDILVDAGVSPDKLSDFDHIYERAGGEDDTDFEAQNLMTLDKFNVKAPDVEIKIKPDKKGLVQKRKIDGKNCLVVTLEGDVELNGIQVRQS